MLDKISPTIPIIDLLSRHDTDIESGLTDMSWDTLVETLSTHDIRQSKNGPCFIPCRLKPRSEWTLKPSLDGQSESFRHDGNVEAITLGVFDLDTPGAFERAQSVLAGYEYVLYSTHSFNSDSPYKFRLALKLDQEIPVEQWRSFFARMQPLLGSDDACGNFSRVYFYPSHSPDAGISPVFKHNVGKSFSYDDILKLERSHNIKSTDLTNLPQAKQGASSVKSSEKKHFSGTALKKRIDYSYEGLKKRHARSISNLITSDSRHSFSMSVIAREVNIAGKDINLNLTYQFLFKAAKEYSTKPLENGDTVREIPELTISALAKYSPEGVRGVSSKIPSSIQSALEASSRNLWGFDKSASAALAISTNKDLQELRETHIQAMRELLMTRDIRSFAEKILKKEAERKDRPIDLRQAAHFIYYCEMGSRRQKGETPLNENTIGKITDILTRKSEDILPANHTASHHIKVWEVMCRSAERSALKGSLVFSNKHDNKCITSNSSSLSP